MMIQIMNFFTDFKPMMHTLAHTIGQKWKWQKLLFGGKQPTSTLPVEHCCGKETTTEIELTKIIKLGKKTTLPEGQDS